MTAEELAEVLKAVNANRPQITQTMNFNAPIGQQIAHVDKIEAHFDKDMGMQIANVGDLSVDKVGKNTKPVEDAEIIPTTTEEAVADAILHVMEAKDDKGDYVFTQKNQWFGIYRILADMKIVQTNGFLEFGRFIDGLNLTDIRVDLNARELSKNNKGTLSERFEKWNRSEAVSPIQFDKINRIAQLFKAKIEELIPE